MPIRRYNEKRRRKHNEGEGTMNEKEARKLAVEIIEFCHAEGQPIAETTVVGIDAEGKYWVADNGNVVPGLTKEQAIDIIVENLAA
jgi:hypothetical protein